MTLLSVEAKAQFLLQFECELQMRILGIKEIELFNSCVTRACLCEQAVELSQIPPQR